MQMYGSAIPHQLFASHNNGESRRCLHFSPFTSIPLASWNNRQQLEQKARISRESVFASRLGFKQTLKNGD